ncbi:MAG: POTRA domain-containing protein [Sodaliphilus pleomorphus]|jgi:outer membrane protein insertion porin family|uniref:BamA/OMP85 family outer membrane protein n=1 Tax=Sodaliphilus pleomorphus TaxID=2606626 RepID=UPI00240A9172|nr:POTRA domain-containing protein [Sodaliphilus pleomorphus]MCI5980749.1 outer membrane protein assembly factor BamA [Muribaculaceae bacterium]MDD6473918.1 POTRA domain-containing protein [Sodaliphilus pleomorphus]MDD6687214.1 POTRA domain-containing protein [Sodaliphilus pleomorphus]MDY2833016.1 POTRA domain-containing protein [Sodaliphilus pleomorphus]
MRYKVFFLLIALLAGTAHGWAQDQTRTVNDTIYNPKVIFSGNPQKYEIAGIKVTGVDNYEDYIIIGYSGLAVGQRIDIPGDEITNAAKRFWHQGLFSKVQIKVDKIYGNKAWLEFVLRQQPRVSVINYVGMKKGEQKDITEKLGLQVGNQMTPNIADRIKMIVEKYFKDKGFEKVTCEVNQREDLSKQNEVIVDIVVDKHSKIKVHKIYIDGNQVLSDGRIKRTMKKTNEKGSLIKLFSQKKFVASDYAADKQRIIDKYNELGYRDARIVSDSVTNYDEKTVDVHIKVDEGKRYYISGINWVGNTVYPTEVLQNVLGMEKGDVYNQKLLNKRTSTDEDAVSNLYLDKGYLFFNLVPVETKVEGDSIQLEMRMYEGKQARINKVVINGNDRLYEKVVRRELRVRPGDLFSKSDLMRSAREIAQTGHFDPEKMDIRPEPNEENGTVDIVMNLQSKANDQVEFSAGWGQTGVIGKLSLKFTNFSIHNLFHPSSYKGIIPQGEGQTFTISGQTNAKYYQAYSISFLDPWFGGKRPNSLSVSAFYSRQTGINSSFYNKMYQNSYYNYYNNYYGGYYNGYNGSYNYEDAYDPSKYLQMGGITVGFGKRLKWPDDYFTLTADLSYQWYSLKNWEYLYYMNNGTSNSLVLGLTLERNSIDNPLYTRRGSTFSLAFHFTPPANLFGHKNWKALSQANTEAAKKDLYKWIEYWKLKFQARTYTPLTDPDGRWTLVLMTRADVGLLGSWNKYLKSPFETFYVGGDGMSGSYTYATETIALRGYDNGQFTPFGSEGYAYDRFVMELHFPLMLSTSATIYPLVFAEAGNAWTSVKKFSPFDLKRSAGVGVRIFLPMLGMMGIDWGYGFDKVLGQKGGSNFHFVLGQEF